MGNPLENEHLVSPLLKREPLQRENQQQRQGKEVLEGAKKEGVGFKAIKKELRNNLLLWGCTSLYSSFFYG